MPKSCYIFMKKEKQRTIGCEVQWLGVCYATAKAAKVLPVKTDPSGLLQAEEQWFDPQRWKYSP